MSQDPASRNSHMMAHIYTYDSQHIQCREVTAACSCLMCAADNVMMMTQMISARIKQ